ncbi:MAG: hypothetical protein OXC38_04375 [Gammaproteobacteria bacterium]|nr:hypothetical protein [Gammaproteobacteria bacterium]
MNVEQPTDRRQNRHERSAPAGTDSHECNVVETADPYPFSKIFGALRGTVTIMPDTDLTLPTGEAWNAEK